MSEISAKSVAVPVRGGTLHCAQWGDAGPVVLAPHGITGSSVSWELVGRRLAGDVRLVAPDLRGRGESSAVPGPYGLDQHGDDLRAILDHFEVEQAVVVGHSMGGYVATVTASMHPDRVQSVVLVDGGIPLPLMPGATVDEVLDLVIGPAVARLSMTFPTREAYLEFWRAHPAFAGSWTQAVEDYVLYDLTGSEPELRSRTSLEAVREDGADTLVNGRVQTALEQTRCPVSVLRAELGMLGAPPPLIPDDLLGPWLEQMPNVSDLGVVRGANHYTVLLGTAGADAVADAVREHTLRGNCS